jgi:hypothetical protein
MLPVVIAPYRKEAGWAELTIPLYPTQASNEFSASNCVSIDVQEGKIEMHIYTKKSFWVRTGLAAAALAGTLLFAGAPAVRADDRGCQRRIVKADQRLHRAVQRFGWQSRQARNARQQLRQAREYCWVHAHRWWDQDSNRWHTDRDWNDNDHDHDGNPDHGRDHDRH